MRTKGYPIAIVAIVALAVSVGCAYPVEQRDWSGYQGPGADHFHQEETRLPELTDPIEPYNRSAGALNHALIRGLVDLLSRVYRCIVPKTVRTHVQNFHANLLYFRRLPASLLQGKFRQAGNETLRFVMNSTVGILGLFDPASNEGLRLVDEDFGQTFATWGWKNSTFTVLPIFGPSTVRDAIGLVPDTLTNPAAYFPPASQFLSFNRMADSVDFYRRFTSSNFDPYYLSQFVWRINRERKLVDFEFTPEDTASVQTLRAVFLSFRDPRFPTHLKTGWVEVPTSGRRLPYSFRMQPGPAPIVFLIPGLGAHRLGNSSLALAEMIWNQGFSVVIVSSAMNFEFMRYGASVSIPGYTPQDAHDVHVALDAIFHELDERNLGQVTGRALMGYSLGAFHTLYIAAAEEDPGNTLIGFDRYVTLDAPVALIHGMEELDRFYNAPLAFPPEEREDRIRSILYKAVHLSRETIAGGGDPSEAVDGTRVDALAAAESGLSPGGPLPFSNLEAEFLIGLSFRITLQAIIYTSQERSNLGVLLTQRSRLRRWAAYQEIADYSYAEYMYAFVLPYYRDRLHVIADSDELVDRNDLHSIEAALRANGKIRNFANKNDFLTNEADVAWFTDVLGESKVHFFTEGGHLGNLYRPEVQEVILESLEDLR